MTERRGGLAIAILLLLIQGILQDVVVEGEDIKVLSTMDEPDYRDVSGRCHLNENVDIIQDTDV